MTEKPCFKIKRVIDVALALFLFFILIPLMVIVAFSAFLTMGRPIFFRQLRPGYKAKMFTIFKFRTMSEAADKNYAVSSDAKRLTTLGEFLRRMSLDELPELFNVIKGDMSLVGPRPLLVQYLNRYTAQQSRRHDVKPGITGWAQVNGRNAISWDDKFKLDLWYVDNQSIALDLRIIFLTVWKIVRRENINQPGQATAEEFKGKGS